MVATTTATIANAPSAAKPASTVLCDSPDVPNIANSMAGLTVTAAEGRSPASSPPTR
jgi:hypothetical protein